jgi:hypothetical protein
MPFEWLSGQSALNVFDTSFSMIKSMSCFKFQTNVRSSLEFCHPSQIQDFGADLERRQKKVFPSWWFQCAQGRRFDWPIFQSVIE